MALKTVNAYLNFDGTASDAIALYESALGANVQYLQRFGEMPEVRSRAMTPNA